jgi:hypothetical protein
MRHAIAGTAMGFATGLVGVGAGPIVVSYLSIFTDLSQREVTESSLLSSRDVATRFPRANRFPISHRRRESGAHVLIAFRQVIGTANCALVPAFASSLVSHARAGTVRYVPVDANRLHACASCACAGRPMDGQRADICVSTRSDLPCASGQVAARRG